MTLLKFFLEWGKHGLGALWLPYIGLSIWFLYQAIVAHKSGGQQQTKSGQVFDDKKTPYKKLPLFWFWVAITVLAAIIHFSIQASYK